LYIALLIIIYVITFIIKESECDKLGKGMDIDTSTELCAALKNKDVVKYVVFRKKDKKDKEEDEFEEYEKKEESLEYYGGSDACQGDSGGPL